MSNKYAGTQTEKNLEAAFAGESMARNKYTYFASKAKKEGFEQIAAIFEETANNEKEHAKLWFKELEGIGDTAQNLGAAADDQHGPGLRRGLWRVHLPRHRQLVRHVRGRFRGEQQLRQRGGRRPLGIQRVHPGRAGILLRPQGIHLPL